MIAQNAVAATSVLAGALFIPVAWGTGRELSQLLSAGTGSRRRDATPVAVTWLITLVLLTQGYIQLFFGYVEHYTLYLLTVGTYLWLGLRCARGATSFLWPCLCGLVAFAFHFSGAVLFPSLLVLAGLELRNPHRRRATMGGLAVVAALVMFLLIVVSRVSEDFEPLSAFASVFKQAVLRGGSNAAYMWSWQHVRDFVNIQLLAGPLGLAIFLPGIVYGVRAGAHRTRAGAFLALAGSSFLGAAWIASEPFLVLGYAREWDMLAPASLGFTVAGLGLFFTVRKDVSSLTAPLIWAVVLSLYHTVPWIAVNADGRRGVERMKTLPLGEGRAATAVGTWYMRHGTDAQAIEWFERALQEYPRNVNAWDKLGLVYVGQNRMNDAARAYARAVEIRPDKIEYRRNLVESLRLSGQFEESLPHNEWLCERQPENLDYWLRLTSALEQTGRADEVPAALERAHAALAEAQRRTPDDYFANFNLGAVEMALDRPAEALNHFQNAYRAQPQSDLALLNMGVAMLRLGRPDEARPWLEQVRSRTMDDGVRRRATELLHAARGRP